MRIGKPRHREEELTLTRAKGAATEPLDGGARTYGCTHTLARGLEGRRSSSIPRRRRVLQLVTRGRERGDRRRWGKGRGGLRRRRYASAIAGGEQLLQPPSSSSSHRRERETEGGDGENRARVFPGRSVRGPFDRAKRADSRPIPIGRP
jgi:hypothetical protein